MAITARLSHKLHQTLGDEAAEDLVNWMQQVDAQRVELRELNELNFSRIDARFEAVDTRLTALDSRMGALDTHLGLLDTRLGSVDERLTAFHEEMRVGFVELRSEMAHLETRLERRLGDLIKWSFVFWVGAVGAIAMLAGVLR